MFSHTPMRYPIRLKLLQKGMTTKFKLMFATCPICVETEVPANRAILTLCRRWSKLHHTSRVAGVICRVLE